VLERLESDRVDEPPAGLLVRASNERVMPQGIRWKNLITRTTRMTMTEKPAKPASKPAKPASKRVRSPKPRTRRRGPDHAEISERAYFIHLEDGGGDVLENWLRAERELTAV
jgi:hypothetical protein